MATGSTLLQLRTSLRIALNERTSSATAIGMWSDADLNYHLKKSYERYYQKLVKFNPDFSHQYVDVTYTASAESVTVTPSDSAFIKEVIHVEDRTNATPGINIPFAESLDSLRLKYPVTAGLVYLYSDRPSCCYVDYVESVATGAITQTFKIYIGPMPAGSRSLRVHYHIEPRDISGGDSYTTGLSSEWEDCIVLNAAKRACLQERSIEGVTLFKQELKEAEDHAIGNMRPYLRRNMRVQFTGDD